MKTWEYLKARSIVEQYQIKLVTADLDPSRPLLIFKIREEITVIYNHKGWVCDYIFKDGAKSWGCALNKGKICFHIIAAQLFIVKLDIDQEWMDGDDFRFVAFTKRANSGPSSSLEIQGEIEQ